MSHSEYNILLAQLLFICVIKALYLPIIDGAIICTYNCIYEWYIVLIENNNNFINICLAFCVCRKTFSKEYSSLCLSPFSNLMYSNKMASLSLICISVPLLFLKTNQKHVVCSVIICSCSLLYSCYTFTFLHRWSCTFLRYYVN